MTSARKHKTRNAARRLRAVARASARQLPLPGRPSEPTPPPPPPPPAEGWKLMSTSVPHLQDAPWVARLALATVEKVAILVAVVVLGCSVLAAALAGWMPSFVGLVLRWLIRPA